MKRVILLTVTAAAFVILTAAGLNAQAKSVDGEWDASMNTPGGEVPMKLVLKADGEKLTGTVKRSRGDAAISGTIKGNDISFYYTVDYNGNSLTISFTGKVTGDTMSGTVSFGGNAEDQWSAKRSPAPKKP